MTKKEIERRRKEAESLERRRAFVEELAAFPWPADPKDADGVPDYNPDRPEEATARAAVVEMAKRHGLTRSDFWDLDEKPGHYADGSRGDCFYPYKGQGWHYKLRRTRNNDGAALFAVLEANG